MHAKAPKPEKAHELIDSLLSVQRGVQLIEEEGYGHSNAKAIAAVSDEKLAGSGAKPRIHRKCWVPASSCCHRGRNLKPHPTKSSKRSKPDFNSFSFLGKWRPGTVAVFSSEFFCLGGSNRPISFPEYPLTPPISEPATAGGDAYMTRDSRYDVLFEPVKIGPVTAKNRFYQVPSLQWHGIQLAPKPCQDA